MKMPFRTGDIDELYDWSDEHSDGVSENPEEQRVGTQASFEEMLERELAKEQMRHDSNVPRRSTPPRKEFLRKGARGWWMENPNAKEKMHKHVLESVDIDENNQTGHIKTASSRIKTSPKRERRSPLASSAGTASPEPVHKDDVHISPVRISSSARRDPQASMNEPRRSLPMWATTPVNTRSDETSEPLTMSRVRQDFENRREREANELADFEALEQELAAEKESYLREKQTMDNRDAKAYYGDDDASWLRDSEDGASLHGESQHLLSGAFRSSYSNLDLGGESSMVFDGSDHVFKSPMPRQQTPTNQRQNRPRQSFAPSEISAVSLNDSEPWGDANLIGHFTDLPVSPIPKGGMASAFFDRANGSRSARLSNGMWRDSIHSRTEARQNFGDQEQHRESLSYSDTGSYGDPGLARGQSSPHDHNHGSLGAPVSSLVQQVFGAPNQATSTWEEQLPSPKRTDSRIASGRGSGKKSKGPSPKPPRSVQGRNSFRPSGTREQAVGENPAVQTARRCSPTIDSAGVLPVSIEEKLAELEEEVKFYKSETLQLQRKKTQYDDELQRLAREKENLRFYQEEQKQLIEQEWQQQRQKMKHEERMFERQMKLKLNAAASTASRKDRAEIDGLKAQIVALQLEAKQASGKMKATNDVLRQRITELEGKNRELSEEIKFLERDRLDQWQKYEDLLKERNTQTVKLDEQRDQPKTVGDITRLSRSAEKLLSSLQFPNRESSQIHAPNPSASTSTTPTYDRGAEYNPGRYRQSLSSSARSSQSSAKSNSGGDGQDDTFAATPIGGQGRPVDEVVHPGGKREITYRDGTKRIFFADGNEKEILPNGNVVIRFTNGDRKEFFPDSGVSVYHYHEAQTKLTTYPDKTKVYEFPNQQIEKSYPDGTTEIQFADGILKTIHPSGDEFSKFPDGTTMLETKDGLREVTLLNGKKVRYYPDGKMTLMNLDGQESEVRSDEELRELMETV